MQQSSSRALLGVLFIVAALIGTPIAVFQLQQQQDIRQRADTTVAWSTTQSAASACPTSGGTAIINVTFKNTEPNRSYYSMNVNVVDRQTGKSVNLGAIAGGQTKTGVIQTNKQSISSGTVDFKLTWTDGHNGTDSRSATYKSVSNCYSTPTPTTYNPSPTVPYSTPTTPPGYPTPTVPPYSTITPTPTICPTLGPVKNIRIDCPNCP